jgi:hypothetical protein
MCGKLLSGQIKLTHFVLTIDITQSIYFSLTAAIAWHYNIRLTSQLLCIIKFRNYGCKMFVVTLVRALAFHSRYGLMRKESTLYRKLWVFSGYSLLGLAPNGPIN